MCTLSLPPFTADHCKVKGIHVRLNLNPVLTPLPRRIGGTWHLDHKSFMSCIKSCFVGPFNFRGVTADYLGGEIHGYRAFEFFSSCLQREIHKRFSVKVEDIKYDGDHLD